MLLFFSWQGCRAWLICVLTFVLIFALTLCHEGLFLLWGGVIFWILLDRLSFQSTISIWHVLVAGAVTCFPFGLGLLILKYYGALSPAQAAKLYDYVAARSDFVPRKDAFDFLTGSLDRTRAIMMQYWANPTSWPNFIRSLLIVSPALVWLNLAATNLAWARGSTLNWKLFLVLLIQGAIFLPLVLCYFGFDIHRWSVACVLANFLILLILAKRGAFSPGMSSCMKLCVFPVLYLNAMSENMLLGWNLPTEYPFFDRIMWLIGVLQGIHPFVTIPPG